MPNLGTGDELSQFARDVLGRTRSSAGVAVYAHADGSLGFLARDDDVGVTRTLRHTVSFAVECRRCRVTVATCTTSEGMRVHTPCACNEDRALRLDVLRSMPMRRPFVDAETFAASVHAELTRDEPFVLYGMVRAFVRGYWSSVRGEPDPRVWARFFRSASRASRSGT